MRDSYVLRSFGINDRHRSNLTPGVLTCYTDDGSYIKVEIPNDPDFFWQTQQWSIYFPDGRKAMGKSIQTDAIIDGNGNPITFTHTGCGTQGNLCVDIVDSVGRKITLDRSLIGEDNIRQKAYKGLSDLEWIVQWTDVLQEEFSYECTSDEQSCLFDSPGHRAVAEIQLPVSTTPPSSTSSTTPAQPQSTIENLNR